MPTENNPMKSAIDRRLSALCVPDDMAQRIQAAAQKKRPRVIRFRRPLAVAAVFCLILACSMGEAPDEMGHQGSVERKVQAIEYLDDRVIRYVKERMDASGEDYRMMVLPDHPTPIRVRTHTGNPVPYMLYDSTKLQDNTWNYNEKEAQSSGNVISHGYELMDYLFAR